MPDITQMSLKAAPIQFATFTPTQYTPQTADPTLLARSMQLQEARQERARESLDAIDTTIASVRDTLNVAEHDWLNEQAANIRQNIDKQLDLGNWQSAIRIARESARDLKRNTELQDKAKVNDIYTKELEKVKSGNYDPITKRRWEDINRYYYDGTADWKATFNPVADIAPTDIFNAAVQRTPTRHSTSGGTTQRNSVQFVNKDGKLVASPVETKTDADGNTVSVPALAQFSETKISTGGSSGYTAKTEQDILNLIGDLLNDSAVHAGLKQNFDNMQWLYDHANDVLKNPDSTPQEIEQANIDLATALKSLEDKNGNIYNPETGFDAWINDKAVQYAKHSAYRHTSTERNSSITTGYSDNGISQWGIANSEQALRQYGPSGSGTAGVHSYSVNVGSYSLMPNGGGNNYNADDIRDKYN